MLLPIQSLWIGDELSKMEQLCILSFIKNGHEFHLYTYDKVKNIPEGTIIKDGNDILPKSMIFKYSKHESVAGFSNYFRYKLIYDKGGYWVDMDTICIKAFDFEEPYVFSSTLQNKLEIVNIGVIKAPIGSNVVKYAFDVCMAKDPTKIAWGETGPELFRESVKLHDLEKYAKNYMVFCPYNYKDFNKLTEPNEKINSLSYAIHLFNEMWRRNKIDKNKKYDDTSVYQTLINKYL